MNFRNDLTELSSIRGLVLAVCLVVGLPLAAVAQDVGFDVDPSKVLPAAGASTGFIPPAFPTDHLAANTALNLRADKDFTATYDTRPLGYVTPVRQQGACGACYAFGSLADFESRILIAGLPGADLSENNLKECHYQKSSCDGGNQYQTMSHLVDAGAVFEACDAYVQSEVACNTGCASQYQVLQWCSISGNTVPDPAVLKQYLSDYGPVHTTLFAGDGSAPAWSTDFNGYDGSDVLYYTGTETPNHSVFLVGWDDDMVHDGGTGAWIVKNSWGTSWGGTCGYGAEGGYFYIAYGSASIGMYSSYISEFMGTNAEASLLRVDEGGFTAGFGAGGTTFWGMAKLVNAGDTYLHRVEFWTTDVTTDVDVYVYDNFSGGTLSSLLCSSLDNSYAEAGYHSVEWGTPVALTPGQDIFVAIKFTNVSYNFPLTVDTEGPPDNNSSYYSFTGGTWTSLYSNDADVTIHARVAADVVLAVDDPVTDPDLPPADHPVQLAIDNVWPNPFNPITTVSFSLPEASHVDVAIIDLQGRLVRTLLSGQRDAGSHDVIWNGTTDNGQVAPAGVYFCTVTAGDQTRSTKLALLK